MFTPSFLGFHTAQRALLAAQTGLNVVNHNISNADVEGYSKQRVDLTTHAPLHSPGLLGYSSSPLGQGVEVQGISRIRDTFLDTQFRNEQAAYGELGTGYETINQLQSIIGEPSFQGLADSMQRVFDAVGDMQNNPESLPARTSFIQQAVDMTTVFQQQASQILDLHENLVGNGNPLTFDNTQVGIRVNDINDQLTTIAGLNRQISTVVSSGAIPNDLLDKRAAMLDNLSKQIGIEVEEQVNHQITLSIGGEEIIRGSKLRDTLSMVASTLPNATQVPFRIQTTTGAVDITDLIPSGEVKAVLDLAGNSTGIQSTYGLFEKLSTLYEQIATQFNALQTAGRDLAGTQHAVPPYNEIFTTDAAYVSGPRLMFMNVNTAFKDNSDKIALADDDATAPANFAGVGDSRNASKMAALKNTTFVALNGQNFEGFHQTLVSALGTDTRSYKDRFESQELLLTQLDGRRQSISGVNVDEEALDLMKFQRAFEASSRIIQTYNEIYQSILNMV